MRDRFTTFDVVKNLKIKQERLREWIDRGFIIPSLQKAEGRGSKNLFSRNDLYIVGIFKYLLDAGLSRERASEAIGGLSVIFQNVYTRTESYKPGAWSVPLVHERKPGKLTPTTLYPAGAIVELSFDGLSQDFEGYIVVNISKIIEKIDATFSEKS